MTILLRTDNLKKYFKVPQGWLHAVDGVSLSIKKGETMGVVGESGCGKSTLGRTILNLIEPTSGQIFFEGADISKLSRREFKSKRKDMQIIFQDPFSSLNPRMTVEDIIGEPLSIFNMYHSKDERNEKIKNIMSTVGLAERLARSYPHELDGGRRQRIGIARAIAVDPKFIVCDEPVSALDVSIQAQILNLLQDLQESKNITYLFITHDLAVVKHVSTNICVMYLGEIIEKSESIKLFKSPSHPYTKALLDAVPIPIPRAKEDRKLLSGEIASPINPLPGCRFAPRCPHVTQRCKSETPKLREISEQHFVACHLYDLVGEEQEIALTNK